MDLLLKLVWVLFEMNDDYSIIFNSDNLDHEKIEWRNTKNGQQLNNTLKRKAIFDINSTKPVKLIHLEITASDLPPLTLSDIILIKWNIWNAHNSIHPRLTKKFFRNP